MRNPVALFVVDSGRQGAWGHIIVCTRQMLAAARRGDWDEVVEIESRRRVLIQDYFRGGIDPQQARQVEAGIREILESDRELLDLTLRERDQASTRVIGLARGASACMAYAKERSY